MEGFNNPSFFIGVVEDNVDPQKMGRVRCRAFGFHSQDHNEVATEDLPWATMCVGTYNAAFKPPAPGAWVFGMFIDGPDAQHPLLLGSLSSMPTQFIDAAYAAGGTAPCDLYQPDMSRLARAEDVQGTSLLTRYAHADEVVETADQKNWSTPRPAYAAQYPHNLVQETASGHTFEMDDTPDNERISMHHRTGTGSEIDSQGNMVHEIRGSNFSVTERNGNIQIKGNCNVSIGGSANILVGNDANIAVAGNTNQTVNGSLKLGVAGNFDLNVGQAFRLKAAKIEMQSSVDAIDLNSASDIRIGSTGSLSLKPGEKLNFQSGAKMSLQAGGDIALDGSNVHLNSGNADGAASPSVSDIGEPVGAKATLKKNYIDRMPMRFTDIDDNEGELA